MIFHTGPKTFCQVNFFGVGFFFREYLARSSGGVVLPGQACTHRSNHLGTQASNCEPHFSNLPCTHLFVRLMKGSFHTLMRGTPTHVGLCSCTFMHIMCIYAHTHAHTRFDHPSQCGIPTRARCCTSSLATSSSSAHARSRGMAP